MSWPIVNIGGTDYYSWDVLLPVDAASTGAAVIYFRPAGGAAGQNIPAIEQGDPGLPADIDTTIVVTGVLDYDDPTPDSASWTQLTPPAPPNVPGVYQLNTTMRRGPAGADASTAIDPDSVNGSKVFGNLIKLNSTLDGFDYAYERVGSRHTPASINNTSAGNLTSTLAAVPVPAQNFDWRPRVSGYTIVTSTGPNVVVDLVVRRDTEVSGNIVGSCPGIAFTAAGAKDRLILSSVLEPASPDAFDRVPAGVPATFYFRTEQQSGSDSYATSASTSRFGVDVMPISDITPSSATFLAVSALTVGATMDAPTLTQVHNLAPTDLVVTVTSEIPTIEVVP